MQKTFPKKQIYDEGEFLPELIEDKITGTSRWSIQHSVVFKLEERFWRTQYQVGATEYQDEQPFEYVDDVPCQEVAPIDKTITVWVPVDSKT